MSKVQFVLCDRVKDYYGITSGLYNSATFVANFLKKQGYEVRLDSVKDSNSIDKVVTEFNPDIVIIEAIWVPPYKFGELFKMPRHRKRKWIVRVHSKAPFLSNEGVATQWIREYTEFKHPHVYIAPNTTELVDQLRAVFPAGRFVYLPNVYEFQNIEKEHHTKEKEWINIGCFGAIRPMKNNYQQALAAIAYADSIGKRLKFHVNSTRVEQRGDTVLKNIRNLFVDSKHKLVEHYWYKHKDFLRVISKMDLGMQVSFSESFNIVSADFVSMGVPILVSDDIGWMPLFSRVSPSSNRQIISGLRGINWCRPIISWIQRRHLKNYNAVAKAVWLKEMHSFLSIKEVVA